MTRANWIAVLGASLLAPIYAQSSGTTTKSLPLARDVIYRILFREVVSVQKKATETRAQFKSDAVFRDYHRTRLELTVAQNAKLTEIAQLCVQQMSILDGQANAIINATKKRHKGAPIGSADSQVPPVPQELKELEARRKAVVLTAADSIAAAFGPGQFAYFESLTRRHVGSGLKTVAAQPK